MKLNHNKAFSTDGILQIKMCGKSSEGICGGRYMLRGGVGRLMFLNNTCDILVFAIYIV